MKNTNTRLIIKQVLSKAEKAVLEKISLSKTTSQIAAELNLSNSTVKNHRHSICQKLGLQPVNNALLIFAMEHKTKILQA